MRTMLRGKVTLLFLALGLLLAIPAIALADNLIDTLDGAAATQTIAAGDPTGFTNDYWIVASDSAGSPQGCDVGTANDTITATFSWPATGTGSLPAGVSASPNSITFDECQNGPDKNAQSVTFTSSQPGTYTIPAPTKSGGTGSYNTNPSGFTLVVNDNSSVTNHAPTVSTDAGNVSGNEGSALANSGAFSDQDNDALTITQLSGAGSVIDNGDGTWDWSYTPNDNGTGTVVVQADDSNGGTVTDSFTWTADNVAPTASVSASPQNALVNHSVTFTGSATDVSSVDQAAGFFWQFSTDGTNYSPATIPNPFASNSNQFTTSFSSCGTKSVSALATDKDGGTSVAASGSVNVYNAHYLSPLNEGMYNTVQAGRVVPVKISVGCATNLTGLNPSIQMLKGEQDGGESTTGADNVETLSVSAADQSGIMRAIDGGYIYNLQVPSTAKANDLFTVRVNPFATQANPNPAGSAMYVVLKIRK
jgi:hypothetical protein